MGKYPATQSSSTFFKEGRFAMSSAVSPQDDGDQIWVLFGGSTPEKDTSEVLVLRKSFLLDDTNFMEITNIM